MKNIIMIAMLALVACDPPTKHTDVQRAKQLIHYYKDARTNVCFAGAFLGMREGVLTTVPCTPEVEGLLEPLPDYYGP